MLIYNNETKQVTHEPEIRVPGPQEVSWIRLLSPDSEELSRILGQFECHPLLIEDCIKLNQRPKMDRYKNNAFLTFFAFEEDYTPVEMGIIIGDNYVITIYKKDIPFLNKLHQEFQEIEGRMTHSGSILYHILDQCVDEYVSITNKIEDQVDRMERKLLRNPFVKIAHDIFQLKRSIHRLRRILVEEKTCVGLVSHQQFPYTKTDTDEYYMDVYDHISRVVDSLDMFRENVISILDLQMSMKADRMNEIMKSLTIVSSIFLPLTFIVGLYGMNFRSIPELNWPFGYAYVWIIMIVCAAGLILYFRKKKWL